MAITIYDIADKAGVSIATVSRVFNARSNVSPKTKKRILDIAKELGYHPQAHAQSLASKKTNSVMVIVPVISNYFFMEVLGGIQDKLMDYKYDLTIYNVTPGKDLFEQVDHLLKRRPAEGYLFISVHLDEKHWAQLHRYGLSITLIDEYYSGFDSVSVDNVEGSYKATKFLLEQGYTSIGMISASPNSKPVKDRMKGFKRAHQSLGIQINPEFVISGDSTYRDGFTERAGYEAMIKMLTLPTPPQACICSSDIQALGALKAMQDIGNFIPIIGYDDIELTEYMGLSTIRQPMRDMGFFATQNLIERMENPHRAVAQTVYTPELILRSSTEVKI